jgi:hypothetical protein
MVFNSDLCLRMNKPNKIQSGFVFSMENIRLLTNFSLAYSYEGAGLHKRISDPTVFWRNICNCFWPIEFLPVTADRIGQKHACPVCELCNISITVEHILLECPKYDTERIICGINEVSMRQSNADLGERIVAFLTNTGLMDDIWAIRRRRTIRGGELEIVEETSSPDNPMNRSIPKTNKKPKKKIWCAGRARVNFPHIAN